jgi:hypothetical protein
VYRRDYVLRVIEQFSRALAVLLKKITGRQLSSAEARAQITEIASQSGLDLDVARSLDSTTLLMWLAPRGDIDAGKFWLMAELLFLAGMQAREEDLADLARTDLQRARLILSRLAVDCRRFYADAHRRSLRGRGWSLREQRETSTPAESSSPL